MQPAPFSLRSDVSASKAQVIDPQIEYNKTAAPALTRPICPLPQYLDPRSHLTTIESPAKSHGCITFWGNAKRGRRSISPALPGPFLLEPVRPTPQRTTTNDPVDRRRALVLAQGTIFFRLSGTAAAMSPQDAFAAIGKEIIDLTAEEICSKPVSLPRCGAIDVMSQTSRTAMMRSV